MDARQKIEAALKGFATFPVWHETSPDDVVHAVRNDNARIVADVGYSGCEDFDKIICAYIAAVCPDNIRELLATHTVEIAAREAEIARLREALVRLLSSDKGIAAATEDELTEAANDTTQNDLLREQAAAILQARAALTQQPTKD